MMKCLRITLEGDIEGHGLRFTAMYYANTLGLKGYAGYETDRILTIVIQGEKEDLDKFATWAMNWNPGTGKPVIRIKSEESGEFTEFTIKSGRPVGQGNSDHKLKNKAVNIFYTFFYNIFNNLNLSSNLKKTNNQ